jgi:enoyl-CoA hydratase/carnithine racemase
LDEQLAGGKLILDSPAEAVARIRINNPERRNPLDHDVLDALAETLPRLDSEIETRCVLLTGESPSFSAGYDLGAISDKTFEKDAEALVAHPFHEAMEAVEAHPWPTVAAINGHCLGGGLELAVSCDLRIASTGAMFGMTPARLGLIYSHTGVRKFMNVVGVARTKELFLTGRNFTAERAEEMGLVQMVVPGERLEEEAIRLATLIAGNAPLAMRGNKKVIQTLNQNPTLTKKKEQELIALRESCFSSEDFYEGIKAFAEKRKPQWQGK